MHINARRGNDEKAINAADDDVAYDLAVELNKQRQLNEAYQVLDYDYQADTSNYLLLKTKWPILYFAKKTC